MESSSSNSPALLTYQNENIDNPERIAKYLQQLFQYHW